VKYRELVRLLEANGWFFERTGKGDHMIYRRAARPRPIVVSGGGKLARDVPK
jgi:predicted RNA binding protein YcfA (HicA-like mRNA interferase family)